MLTSASTPGSLLFGFPKANFKERGGNFLNQDNVLPSLVLQYFITMKVLSITLQTAGLLLCAFSCLNVFFLWTTNDLIWVMSLFIGMDLFMLGYCVDVAMSQPYSSVYKRKRKLQIRNCIAAVILLSIVIIVLLIKYITL